MAAAREFKSIGGVAETAEASRVTLRVRVLRGKGLRKRSLLTLPEPIVVRQDP